MRVSCAPALGAESIGMKPPDGPPPRRVNQDGERFDGPLRRVAQNRPTGLSVSGSSNSSRVSPTMMKAAVAPSSGRRSCGPISRPWLPDRIGQRLLDCVPRCRCGRVGLRGTLAAAIPPAHAPAPPGQTIRRPQRLGIERAGGAVPPVRSGSSRSHGPGPGPAAAPQPPERSRVSTVATPLHPAWVS